MSRSLLATVFILLSCFPAWAQLSADFTADTTRGWGEKLYESNSIYDNWDGSYEGKIVENEAYVYIIETMGTDLIKRNYKGTVTVVR